MIEVIMLTANYIFLMAFLCLFIPMRYSRTKTVVICLSACLGMLAFDFAKYIIFPQSKAAYVIATVIQIIIVQGTAFLISLTRDSKTLFTGMCASNYVLIGSLSGVIFFMFTGNIYMKAVVSVLVYMIILFFLSIKIRKIYLGFFEKDMGNWWGLCLIPALYYCSLIFLTSFPNPLEEIPYNIPGTIMLIITMLVSYVIIFKYVDHEMNRSEIYWQNNMFQSYIRGLESLYESVKNSEQEIKILRHDMRHYTQMIHTLLETNNYSEIERVLQSITDVIDKTKIVKYCENIQVNCILSGLMQKAENLSVDVDADIRIPEDIPINDLELASVIANLLENAIESVKDIKEEKQVSILARYMDGRLIIETINRCEKEIFFDSATGLPISGRGEKHGLGLKSVSAFAKKTGANFDCYCEENRFTVRLLADIS